MAGCEFDLCISCFEGTVSPHTTGTTLAVSSSPSAIPSSGACLINSAADAVVSRAEATVYEDLQSTKRQYMNTISSQSAIAPGPTLK